MLRRVYGQKKQGAAFGYTKVGGYDVRLRGLHPLLVTVSTPLAAPVIAAARLRAGNAASARGAASLIAEGINTARGCGAAGEVVVRMDSAFYSRNIAETTYTAFASTRQPITARLIVRGVKRLDPRQVPGQQELFTTYRYHAVFTDSPFILTQAEAHPRGATIRTQIINVAARIASHARHLTLHLPLRWPWQQAWDNLFTATHPPPV